MCRPATTLPLKLTSLVLNVQCLFSLVVIVPSTELVTTTSLVVQISPETSLKKPIRFPWLLKPQRPAAVPSPKITIVGTPTLLLLLLANTNPLRESSPPKPRPSSTTDPDEALGTFGTTNSVMVKLPSSAKSMKPTPERLPERSTSQVVPTGEANG